MGPHEWTAISGGPVIIYATRMTLAKYYNYRIEFLSTKLRDQRSERARTIQKLKDATKYDTTLELLEKYGDEPRPKTSRESVSEDDANERKRQRRTRLSMDGPSNANVPSRTGLPPPPTANIPRGPPPSLSSGHPVPEITPAPRISNALPVTEEFAPNAFSTTPPPAAEISSQSYGQYDNNLGGGSHWYDRVMDLLLGEDEMAAKNRFVLICERCRLVNGQAPPGTRQMSEIGMWKCMGCGKMNGEMDEGRRLVRDVLNARKPGDATKLLVHDQDGGTNPASTGSHENMEGEEREDSHVDSDDSRELATEGVGRATGSEARGIKLSRSDQRKGRK